MQNSDDSQNSILNAVIGFPLEHTLSPLLHTQIYKELGLNAEMRAFPGKDIAELILFIKKEQIQLTAVTMPHKQSIMPFLDEISPEAKAIGAVNTVIQVSADGVFPEADNTPTKLLGFNTDITGITHALRNFFEPQDSEQGTNAVFPVTDNTSKSILILGAGGAAKPAAYHVAQQLGLKSSQGKKGNLFYHNRTVEKAQKLADQFGGQVLTHLTKAEIEKQNIGLIINTTPLGMHPYEGQSPIPEEEIPNNITVFDLIYNPLKTPLMKAVEARGGSSISGIEMFAAQGLKQIELWRSYRKAYSKGGPAPESQEPQELTQNPEQAIQFLHHQLNNKT
jgi:shikimate dehydrogenase